MLFMVQEEALGIGRHFEACRTIDYSSLLLCFPVTDETCASKGISMSCGHLPSLKLGVIEFCTL